MVRRVKRASRRRVSTPILFAAGALLTVLGNEIASAANLTWDITPGTAGTGDGAITDGSGTWDNTTGNFTVDGGANNIAWSNTTNANDTAVFGGSAPGATVTGGNVAVTPTGITLGGISILANSSPTYNIGGGTLTFAPNTGTISLSNSTTFPNLLISSVIAGNALNIITTNTNDYAYITLAGTNTYSGGTTFGNYIDVTASNNLAFGIGNVATGSGFTLSDGTTVTLANNFSSGSNTFYESAGSGTLTLNGNLTGSGTFDKNGGSTLVLSGNNSGYTGTVELYNGTIRVFNSSTALGTGMIVAGTSTANAASSVTLATSSGSTSVSLANNIAITNNGTGLTTLSLDGGYATLTLNGIISGNGNLAKVSTGTVILNGSNTYAGTTNISAGTLELSAANATLGTGNVNISSGATLYYTRGGGLISNNIGGAGSFSTLNGGQTLSGTDTFNGTTYVGAGSLNLPGGFLTNLSGTSKLTLAYSNGYTSNVIDTASTADTTSIPIVLEGNGQLTFSGTGSLTASGSVTNYDTNSKLFTLQGSGSATYTGVIGGGSTGVISFAKAGPGNWTLSNAETYTGTTTISGGTLVLSTGGSIASTAALSIGSTGTNGASKFNISSGNTAVPTFASTTLLTGQSFFNNAGSAQLNLNSITRNIGATVDFGSTSSGGGVTTTTANTNGILGGYATTDSGASFATVNGSNVITAYNGGTTTSALGNASAGYPALVNLDVNSSPILDGPITPNSIRFIGAAADTLTLTGTNPIASGGILIPLSVGAYGSNISGGTITGPTTGGDLIIQQYDTAAALTIASTISDTSPSALTNLLKTGGGTLNLNSATYNYSGTTIVNAGTLQLSGTPGSGYNGVLANTSGIAINNGGTLLISSSNALGYGTNHGVLTLNDGTLTSTAGYYYIANTLTMTGGTVNGTGPLDFSNVNIGGANLNVNATSDSSGVAAVISAPISLYSNNVNFNVSTGTGGAASDLTISEVISGSYSLIKTGTGTLTLSGTNTFTGSANISAGTVITNTGNVAYGAFGKASGVTIGNGATVAANTDNSVVGGNAPNVPITINSGGTLTNTGNNSNHLGGLLTLAGGTLATASTNTDAYGSWNLDRGLLATANTTMPATNVVPNETGGTYFNVATGVTLTVTGTLTHPSYTADTGIIKIGLGTLTLTGYNTYNSSLGTNVNAGTLILAVGSSTGAIRGPLTVNNGGFVEATASNALGYSTGTSVTTLTVNAGGLFDNTTTGNEGYITNLNMGGGTVTSTGGGTLNFLNGYNISSTGSTTASLISAPIVFRGAGLNAITAAGVSSGPDLTISGAIGYGSGGSGAFNKSGAGTLELTGSNSYTGGTTITAGTLILGSASAYPTNTPLTISSGAAAQILNHSTGSPIVPIASAVTNNGTIDLTNNAMIVHSGSIGTLTIEVADGFNSGTWNGTNASSGIITSTLAAADTTHLTAVGVVTGLTSFENQSVLSSDVLLKYTYYGDANLDGHVDGSDYSLIDNGYLNQLTGWYNGDFNYDGVINGSDYTLIDNAFNSQGAHIAALVATPTAQLAGSSSSVPEPATLSLISLAAIGLLGRRRAKAV
jgi:fibronectin-binding autotransporter adhesin